MSDVHFLAVFVAFGIATWVLVALCDRLMRAAR
jgi:hypothetical protein